jgi:hypothetical protein
MIKNNIILGLLLAVLISACAPSAPIERLSRELNEFPEYSIILEDMKEEGNFLKEYFHRYKIAYGKPTDNSKELEFQSTTTDWYQLSKNEYEKYYDFLGMVLVSKTADGKVSGDKYPPGYQYVGDPRYGNWRQDSGGNSFWEFYGKYALLSHMFGMFGRPVYRTDWNGYRDFRGRGTPYYGSKREYGTNGTFTKRTNKSFFERRQRMESAKKARFGQRIKQRARRSKMSGFRRRSGGFGK